MSNRYFSHRELLLGGAAILWLSLFSWFLFQSDKTWGDILVNAINDVLFAIFVVVFVEYSNERDRIQRNKSRRRAVAWAVNRFNFNMTSLIHGMIFDGIASAQAEEVPTKDVVEARAKHLRSSTYVFENFAKHSLPYGAFFITYFTGRSAAKVHPPRSSAVWLSYLAKQLDDLYLQIFQIDNGFLSDEVVDALTRLKSNSLVVFCRDALGTNPINWGYWPEEDLATLIKLLETIQSYVLEVLDTVGSPAQELVAKAITGGINLRSRSSESRL